MGPMSDVDLPKIGAPAPRRPRSRCDRRHSTRRGRRSERGRNPGPPRLRSPSPAHSQRRTCGQRSLDAPLNAGSATRRYVRTGAARAGAHSGRHERPLRSLSQPTAVSAGDFHSPISSSSGPWRCRFAAGDGRRSQMPLLLPPSSPCAFCEYLVGERPHTILDRSNLTALLVTYEQRGRGHLLVIPVHHRETILELNRHEQAAVMFDVLRATAAIVGGVRSRRCCRVAEQRHPCIPVRASPQFPRRRYPARWRHGVG